MLGLWMVSLSIMYDNVMVDNFWTMLFHVITSQWKDFAMPNESVKTRKGLKGAGFIGLSSCHDDLTG